MAGGALEDFSRRPLQYKVMVFAGIGVLPGLLYWQFVLSPLRKEREDAAADLDAQKAEASRLKKQKKDGKKYKGIPKQLATLVTTPPPIPQPAAVA